MPKKPNLNQGSLFIRDDHGQTWKAPEVLPHLDDRFKRIGFDTETDGVDWRGRSRVVGYAIALEDRRKYYLPVGHIGGGNLDRGYVSNWLRRELRGKELVTCEGKFDIQITRKEGVDLEAQGNTIREIQYGAALLTDVRTSFQLGDLGEEYCGRRKIDIDRTKIWEAPASLVGPYAEEDALLTLDIDARQRPLLAEQGLERVLELENKLVWCVCEMERNGVPLDVTKLARWRQEAQQKRNQALLSLSQETGIRNFKPNSALELEKLFKQLGLEYGRTAPTQHHPDGLPSFTNKFLNEVQHPLVRNVQLVKAIDSLRTKYLDKYWHAIREGMLYYSLHQLKADEYGTISGRFSSSKVNIQQVFDPERQEEKLGFMEWLIRELFLPVRPSEPPAWWVKADASQIEFRLFVHYSKSARLIKRFCEDPDVDFHQMVADLCRIKRKPAKGINFGKLFGMGREKMARQLQISQQDADLLFDQYNQMFPETQDLMNQVMDIAKRRGYVMTMLGRRARFPDGDRLHSALNRVIQGSAADILKLKLLEVYDNRKFLDYHKLLFTVHDDINFATYNLRKVRYIKECLEAPIQELKVRVPILWDVEVGKNWSMNYGIKRKQVA